MDDEQYEIQRQIAQRKLELARLRKKGNVREMDINTEWACLRALFWLAQQPKETFS